MSTVPDNLVSYQDSVDDNVLASLDASLSVLYIFLIQQIVMMLKLVSIMLFFCFLSNIFIDILLLLFVRRCRR